MKRSGPEKEMGSFRSLQRQAKSIVFQKKKTNNCISNEATVNLTIRKIDLSFKECARTLKTEADNKEIVHSFIIHCISNYALLFSVQLAVR